MIRHSFKQIIRSFWKHKSFTIINGLGLSVAIAVAVIIYMIADYEKSFDNFHLEAANIYRVVVKSERGGTEEQEAIVPYPTAKLLRNEHHGLKATQLHLAQNTSVRIDNNVPFKDDGIVFADSLFFSVFDFAGIPDFIVSGDPMKALGVPGKIVLTESTAKRYFGDANPMGRTVRIDAKLDAEVAGIIRNMPAHTHLPFNALVSFGSLTNAFVGGLDINDWGFQSNGYCYINTQNGPSVSAIERSLRLINEQASSDERDNRDRYFLQPMQQIHFDPSVTQTPSYTVSPRYLTLLLLLGGFILLIACVNYVNLSTSLAFSKAKEIGVRKTIGASQQQLFAHYMSESLLLTAVATIAGCSIAFLCLPAVNGLLGKSLSAIQMLNTGFIINVVLAMVLMSFLSGLYPALVLTNFKPIESLKNGVALPGKASTLLRKGLVVFQFTTSIVLIICTLVIAQQMQYFNAKSLGFNKEAVVEVGLPSPDSSKIEHFRTLLQRGSGIQQLSFCLGAPVSDNGVNTSLKAPELSANTDYSIKVIACDKAYLATYGIRLLAGRRFLSGEEKNLGSSLVVNETLVKTLGYVTPSDAIGKKVTIGINEYNAIIIGVVKDFHTASLHQAIGPVGLMPFPFFYYAAGVRLHPTGLRRTLAQIEAAFKAVYPESVYSVSFIDEHLEKLYKEETRNYHLFKIFSGISVFICCIGLWGLISFVIVRRTKEIGIRKVLGASVTGIMGLLSKDFMRLILLALLLASPLAAWFMHQWLQNYAYRIGIGWWVFVAAGGGAIGVALLTISFQAIKAAVANPVKSLRTE